KAPLIAPSVFHYWWTDFYKHLWGDEYNQIDAPLKWPTRAQTVQLIKQESSLSWIDDITTTEQESLSDLISQSFTTALGKLQNEFGDNRSHWKWGCVNNTHIGHVEIGRASCREKWESGRVDG